MVESYYCVLRTERRFVNELEHGHAVCNVAPMADGVTTVAKKKLLFEKTPFL